MKKGFWVKVNHDYGKVENREKVEKNTVKKEKKKVNENSEEFLSTVRVDVSNQTKMPTTPQQGCQTRRLLRGCLSLEDTRISI